MLVLLGAWLFWLLINGRLQTYAGFVTNAGASGSGVFKNFSIPVSVLGLPSWLGGTPAPVNSTIPAVNRTNNPATSTIPGVNSANNPATSTILAIGADSWDNVPIGGASVTDPWTIY